MEPKNIFKGPALIAYLVKKLGEKYSNKQVGKTIIQKLIFLFLREINKDQTNLNYDFSLHHYGPFSSELAADLNFTENIDFIRVEWRSSLGYFLKVGEDISFERHLTSNEKEKLNQIALKYGNFDVKELSILATALYIKDNFNTPTKNIPEIVRKLKADYSIEQINEILDKFRFF